MKGAIDEGRIRGSITGTKAISAETSAKIVKREGSSTQRQRGNSAGKFVTALISDIGQRSS